jgi:hypothetical protein
MEEIISKATVELDKNNIPPFAKRLYQIHLEKAILKILSRDVIKNFKNWRLEPQTPQQRQQFTLVRFKDGELRVTCILIRYEEKTGFRQYRERIPNFIIWIDIEGNTTVKYRGKDGYRTLLTNDLHMPCNLKF